MKYNQEKKREKGGGRKGGKKIPDPTMVRETNCNSY